MELVSIGKIFGSHNLKGAMKISLDIDDLDALIGEKIIVTTEKGEDRILTIKKANNTMDNKWIVEFLEIISKDETIPLRNALIKVRKDLVNLPEYFNKEEELLEMFVFDLIKNENLGNVISIFATPAHDILVVEDDEHEILIPNIDFFVKKIDKEENLISVELLDGMKEKKKKKSLENK